MFRANSLYGNPGAGVIIRDAARPRFVHNTITNNGNGGKRPGIEIHGAAQPVLTGNMVWNNAGEAVWAPPQFRLDTIRKENFIGFPERATPGPQRLPEKPRVRTPIR